MRYITGPKSRIWVAVNDELASNKSDEELKNNLKKRTESVQAWFFNLDDNHAPSPAKNIAYKRVGTGILDPKFISWALAKGMPARFDKGKETKAWQDYVDRFLRNEDALKKVKEIYNEEKAIGSLYPGVKEFVDLLSGSERFYVTRDIAEVAEAYCSALGLNGFFAEESQKGRAIEKYLRKHNRINVIGIDGDFEDDAEMIDVAKFYGKDVVSFYFMDKPKDSLMNKKFDYAASKDRSGLVEILRQQI